MAAQVSFGAFSSYFYPEDFQLVSDLVNISFVSFLCDSYLTFVVKIKFLCKYRLPEMSGEGKTGHVMVPSLLPWLHSLYPITPPEYDFINNVLS